MSGRFSPLLVLSLSAMLLMMGVGMIVALLPQHVHAMTGTLASVGLVASVFALAYLAAQLPVGILADRFGAKRFLVTGYLLCALSGLAFLAARTADGIFLGRALQGLGEAPIWALGPALLALAYPASRGRAIGTYNAAIHAGLTLGPLLGLFIAPDGGGGLPFLVFAVLCFAAGMIVLIFLPAIPLPARPATAATREIFAILRQRKPVILLTGILLYGAGYGIFVSVLPVSLAETHGFGRNAISLLFVLFYAAVSLSQIVAGIVSDHIGRYGFLVWSMALAAGGIGAFSAVSGLWAYLPLGLASIGLGMFCVTSIAELNDCVSDALRGAISASYYFFWGAGYVLGPLIASAAASETPALAYLCLSAALGGQALVILLGWRR